MGDAIHCFKDNDMPADYGPTIILEHTLDDVTFYTLYGHLSRRSLKGIHIGQAIEKSQQIATVGKPFENDGWPTHVHFQIIDDMKEEFDNYKGVIEPSKVPQ
ncbi:MAG: peptidoglycan DD-metalloendopeptidase family protein [Gammaproteobacteria bacterium]|nr:peptidoglycan DD-metalloendopeptidase family protein [Gammaproteobacteria bacterium]